MGVSTGHNPAYPELKRTIDHIKQAFEEYLEDPNYVQSKIHLTPLESRCWAYKVLECHVRLDFAKNFWQGIC